jgi:tRNA (cytidine32/uridine32-2'-O)-methyltransferase
MYQALDRVRIVLVNTSHTGNIGATARAMKTMGLSRLYLVQPLEQPGAVAVAMASGADDVLGSAQIFSSLDDALRDCILVIGTTARSRRLEWPFLAPAECAHTLLRHSEQGDVALVFGPERAGLTNEDLARCRFMTSIPANSQYSSLNLAAAVQVYGYELRRILELDPGGGGDEDEDKDTDTDTGDEVPATNAILAGFHEHLHQALRDIGVITNDRPYETLLRRLRRLFNKAQLTITEVNILRGILSAAQGRKQQRNSGIKPD